VETQVFRDEQGKEGFRFRLRSSASDQLELCRNCTRAKSDVHISAGILGEPLGSFAYAKSHKNSLDNHIAAIVLGNRQGPVTKLNLGGRKEVISVFETLASSRQAFGKVAVKDKINFDNHSLSPACRASTWSRILRSANLPIIRRQIPWRKSVPIC
jgi:hypothetical protein